MLVLELGRPEKVEHLTFSPDGRTLAATGDFGVALWYALAAGQRAEPVAGTQWSRRAGFSADGRWLFAACGGRLLRINAETRAWSAAPPLWPDGSFAFSVSPSEPLLLTAQHTGVGLPGVVRLWRPDLAYPESKVWERKFDDGPFRGVPYFVGDGARFARVETVWDVHSIGHRVALYHTATGEPDGPPVATPHGGFVSPDGRFLTHPSTSVITLTALADRGTAVVRNATRKHFTGVAFSPDGRFLAATSNDATVRLFDTATWAPARTFTWRIGRMRSVCFSPDGAVAAAGGDRGQVVVWDVDG